MPLTSKGRRILANMRKRYGNDRGESVFYASQNKGTITGVEKRPASDRAKKAAKHRRKR